MSNSAWYQKLWRKKMAGLPVKEDSDAAWANMRQALDEQMPVQHVPVNKPGFLSGTKLIRLLSYILPSAVVISAGIYYALPALKKNSTSEIRKSQAAQISPVKPFGNQYGIRKVDSISGNHDGSAIDSLPKVPGKNKTQDNLLSQSLQGRQAIAEKGNPFIERESIQNKPLAALSKRNGGSGNNISPEIETEKKDKSTRLIAANAAYHKGRLADLSKKRKIFTVAGSRVRREGGSVLHSLAPGQSVGISSVKRRNVLSKRQDTIQPVIISHVIDEPKSDPLAALSISDALSAGITIAGENKNDASKGAGNPGKPAKATKAKQLKSKPVKSKQAKAIITPPYNYGVDAGLNKGNGSSGMYFGVFGSYAIKTRWLVNAGLRLNTSQSLSGEFSHVSYYRPDSLPPFKVIDERKVMVLNIPLTLEYKLSNLLSVKAGPVISFAIRQSGISTTLSPIVDQRDTVYHGAEVKSAMANTGVNKLNVGFTGGLSLHLRRFDINGSYQLFSPFKISNAFGAYSKPYQTFQLGIAYRFK